MERVNVSVKAGSSCSGPFAELFSLSEADRDWITDAMVRMGEAFEKAGQSNHKKLTPWSSREFCLC